MKENLELERSDLVVEPSIEVDEGCTKATAYLETWFDVDQKFGTHTNVEEGSWVNLYATYDTKTQEISLQYQVDREDGSEFFDYEGTEAEKTLIRAMMEECCQKHHSCSLEELCRSVEEQVMGGI